MKLVVLGATGGTGLEIVRQAIEHGHSVTALVRNPDALKEFKDSVAVVRGDVLNGLELQQVLKGRDAVLSSFGPRVPESKADATLLRRFAVALTNAMRHEGVRRVVVELTAFLFKDSIIPPTYLFGRLFFPVTVADATAAEAVFRQSELDWTIVRPPRLTNKPQSRKYRTREGHLPAFGFSVSRADVADFMIKAAENHALVGKVVGVSN